MHAENVRPPLEHRAPRRRRRAAARRLLSAATVLAVLIQPEVASAGLNLANHSEALLTDS